MSLSKYLLDTLLRLLDRGKSVPICFQYRGFIIQLEGDMALGTLAGGLE